MALFSGSSGGGRRPLGPRPFSGRERSAQAPALRPHGDPRRATAAPFQAIPELTTPDGAVSLATPHDAPIVDSLTSGVATHADLAPQPMPIMAPSVLRVDDIRSEPFGWESPPAHEPEAAVIEVAPEGSYDVPEPVAVPFVEAVVEVVDTVSDAAPAVEEEAPEVMASFTSEVTEDATSVPTWSFSEPEAMIVEDDYPHADLSNAESAAPVEYRAPMLTPVYVMTQHDASSLVSDDAAAVDDSESVDWFGEVEVQAQVDERASWVDDDESLEVPVNSPWTDLDEIDAAPTLETEAIAEPEVAPIEVLGAEVEATSMVDVLVEGETPAVVSLDVALDASPVDVVPDVASVASVPDVGPMDLVADVIAMDVVPDAADVAAPIEVLVVPAVPDESWWPSPPADVERVVASPAAPEPSRLVTRRTPPVDGLAALEALVTETQGAERAVEALEAVARMIRSREIVVSVGAGASAESVLASILASLLSHPS